MRIVKLLYLQLKAPPLEASRGVVILIVVFKKNSVSSVVYEGDFSWEGGGALP